MVVTTEWIIANFRQGADIQETLLSSPERAVEVSGFELAGLYAWEASEVVEPDPEDP